MPQHCPSGRSSMPVPTDGSKLKLRKPSNTPEKNLPCASNHLSYDYYLITTHALAKHYEYIVAIHFRVGQRAVSSGRHRTLALASASLSLWAESLPVGGLPRIRSKSDHQALECQTLKLLHVSSHPAGSNWKPTNSLASTWTPKACQTMAV